MNHFNFSESWALIVGGVAAVSVVFFFFAGLFEFVNHVIERAEKQ